MRADTSPPDVPPDIRGRRAPLISLAVCWITAAVVLLCACAQTRTADRPDRPKPAPSASPSPVPRPVIVPRSRWIGDDGRHQPRARYAERDVAVIVHHTDSPNDYDCADAPKLIRYLREGHTDIHGWDDIGYNFVIDRCGTIYEGRAGGVDRPVIGAHAQGFNRGTVGVAVLGTFTAGNRVPKAVEKALAALAAWKLGLSHIDASGTVQLVSTNDLSRYRRGDTASLPAITGHDDEYETDCPGAALTARLPAIRKAATRIQRRAAQQALASRHGGPDPFRVPLQPARTLGVRRRTVSRGRPDPGHGLCA